MRVLVVEDEAKMASLLRRGLREAGFAVDVAERGEDALWMAGAHPYDAIILDVMLPGIDGVQTCRGLRDREIWAPVLMLTAKGETADRVAGLDGGADDYMVKPFSFTELGARLRALIRRRPATPGKSRCRSPSSARGCARLSAAGPTSGRSSWRSAICASTPRAGACGAATPRSRCRRPSSPCSRR